MKKIIFIFILILILIIFIFQVQNKLISNKETKLKYAAWGSQSEVCIINSAIKDFNNLHPDIKIEFIHIPQNYFQKIHLLFASNLAPDIVFMNNQYIQMYINAGLLENLNKYFPDSNKIFFKQTLDAFSDNDKLYAIPRDISNLVIYYNKDIFKKNNIKVPDKINSIYELKNLAIKLTTKNNFGINTEDDPLFLMYYLTSNGGGLLSDDKKNILIKKEKSLEALNLYSDLINKYHCSPSKAQIGSMTTAQMFINGNLAMYLGGKWMIPKFKETLNFNWDIIEFPANSDNKVYIDASGWTISSKSTKKREAVEFIKYLSSKQISDEFAKSGLIIPARIDSAEEYFYKNKNETPFHNYLFMEMIENSKPTPITKNYRQINDIMKEKLQNILHGNENPENSFDEKTIKKLEKLLQ